MNTGKVLSNTDFNITGTFGVIVRLSSDPIGFAPPQHVARLLQCYPRLEEEDGARDGSAALFYGCQSGGTVAGNALARKLHVERCRDGFNAPFNCGIEFGS